MIPTLHSLKKSVILSLVIIVAALLGVGAWGGANAAILAVLLIVLEVTLSFDNAVVNARVLRQMPTIWRRRFLTWGILVSVVFTRALLPILIIAASAFTSPFTIARIAFTDSAAYVVLLAQAHTAIAAFGGMFLVMVGLTYFFDDTKNMHWIHSVESRLAAWGKIEAVEIGISLATLLLLALLIGQDERATFLFAGTIGIALYIFVRGIAGAFSLSSVASTARAGVGLFVYLNVLDAAFSLDSVIGAFALTTMIPVIVIGLGAGAYVVRFLTLVLVEQEVLGRFVYLEHGAHWAIIGLAAAMLADLFVHVPEPLTGLVGFAFVTLAYWSSVRLRESQRV